MIGTSRLARHNRSVAMARGCLAASFVDRLPTNRSPTNGVDANRIPFTLAQHRHNQRRQQQQCLFFSSKAARYKLAALPTNVKERMLALIDIPDAKFSQVEFDATIKLVQDIAEQSDLDDRTLNLSIDLIEKFVVEMAKSIHAPSLTSFRKLNVFNIILEKWRVAWKAGRRDTIPTPKEFIRTLFSMSRELPELGIKVALNQVVQASTYLEDETEAPLVVEKLIKLIRRLAEDEPDARLCLTSTIINHAVAMWALSATKRPEAADKITKLLQIADEEKSIKLNSLILTNALMGFTVAQANDQAADALQRMIDLKPNKKMDEKDKVKAITSAILSNLNRHRATIGNSAVESTAKVRALKGAEKLFRTVKRCDLLSKKDTTTLEHKMLEIYSRSGDLPRVEKIFAKLDMDANTRVNILMTAYKKQCKVEEATDLLKIVLSEDAYTPSMDIFASVLQLHAAESNAYDTYEDATKIFNLIESDPKCIALNLKPNLAAFNAILYALSNSKSVDNPGQKAEDTIGEMLQRNVEPDQKTFTFSIECCYRSHDLARAERLLEQMEKSDTTPPTVNIYNQLIEQWSHLATVEAAQRCDQLLDKMREATDKRPRLIPNYTTYNNVIRAWDISGDPDATVKKWQVRYSMQQDKVEPDVKTLTLLLNKITKVVSMEMTRLLLTQAEELLVSLETQEDATKRPKFLHYNTLIKGWLHALLPDRAALVLDKCCDAYIATLNVSEVTPFMKPSYRVFEKIMSKSMELGKPLPANAVLQRMRELHDKELIAVGPDPKFYRELMETWKKSKEYHKDKHIEELKEKLETLKAKPQAQTSSPVQLEGSSPR